MLSSLLAAVAAVATLVRLLLLEPLMPQRARLFIRGLLGQFFRQISEQIIDTHVLLG